MIRPEDPTVDVSIQDSKVNSELISGQFES
jgi:hypothetical protein